MTLAKAYYNEIDPAACAVLRELIARDVILPGDVDDRSIKDVKPNDLRGYTQAHFFAGGGLWSVAARIAGWPDERPLWTGSCPCQPFSAAGKRAGVDDPRHLWPDLYRLISACRPPVVMGEQTSGADGYGWFDGVRADLEIEAYAGRAVDIPVCAVDGPHQRNRLYWVAVEHAQGERRRQGRPEHELRGWRDSVASADVRLQPDAQEQQRRTGLREVRTECDGRVSADGNVRLQSDADRGGRDWWQEISQRETQQRAATQRPHARNGSWWADAEWLISPLDGKARRSKPGIRFLVDGLPGRVDLWSVGGNAISPIIAAENIAAFLDAEADLRGSTVIGDHGGRAT